MTRSPNGLKDDAFENHAQKTAPKNDAPNTVFRKRCSGNDVPERTSRRRPQRRHPGDDIPFAMIGKPGPTRRCGKTAPQPQRNRIT